MKWADSTGEVCKMQEIYVLSRAQNSMLPEKDKSVISGPHQHNKKMKSLIVISALTLIGLTQIKAQYRKIDTTLQYGKAGYHLICDNKNATKNLLIIKPIGFENTARDISFYAKGIIVKAETDDFNNDGYPDLVVYIFTGDKLEKGTVMGISSSENKSFVPIYFPDIIDDPKIRTGYKGYDEFSLMEGSLLRKFPIYAPADSTGNTIKTGKRIVIYKVKTENERLMFKTFRSYDIKE
jgi:hypothetical protein